MMWKTGTCVHFATEMNTGEKNKWTLLEKKTSGHGAASISEMGLGNSYCSLVYIYDVVPRVKRINRSNERLDICIETLVIKYLNDWMLFQVTKFHSYLSLVRDIILSQWSKNSKFLGDILLNTV